MDYNGKRVRVWRRYNSLKNFVGENKVYPLGEILCVSTRNNDSYDLSLEGDGRSTFIQLYKRYKDSAIDTSEEIARFLSGFSGNKTLKEVLKSIFSVVEEGDGTKTIRINTDVLDEA